MRRRPYLRPGTPAFELSPYLALPAVQVNGHRVDLAAIITALVERRLAYRHIRPRPAGVVRVHRMIRECPRCERFITVIGTSIVQRCVCAHATIEPEASAEVAGAADAAIEHARQAGRLRDIPDARMTRNGACPYCGQAQHYEPSPYDDTAVWSEEAELPEDAVPDGGRHWCLEPR
jgi:hypothetical protein